MDRDVVFRKGIAGRVPDALILHPGASGAARPLVSVHGIAREIDAMARALVPAARAAGRTVVLPLFDAAHWPTYQRAAGRDRADQALLRLMSALRAEGILSRGRVDLAGFSGGAQFAHRFTWIYPDLVARLAVSSAGWWTFPDAAPFPYGMGASTAGPAAAPVWLRANLRAFLDRDIVVRVGAQDTVVDRNTRSGRSIDAQQGRDRLTRARRWTDALRAATAAKNLPDRVDFDILPKCGHDFVTCARAGLAEVFLYDRSVPRTHRSVLEGIPA